MKPMENWVGRPEGKPTGVPGREVGQHYFGGGPGGDRTVLPDRDGRGARR